MNLYPVRMHFSTLFLPPTLWKERGWDLDVIGAEETVQRTEVKELALHVAGACLTPSTSYGPPPQVIPEHYPTSPSQNKIKIQLVIITLQSK